MNLSLFIYHQLAIAERFGIGDDPEEYLPMLLLMAAAVLTAYVYYRWGGETAVQTRRRRE